MLILFIASELKASMSASGVPTETQQKLLGLYGRNTELSAEVKALQDKLDALSKSGGTYVSHLTVPICFEYTDVLSTLTRFGSIRTILPSNKLKSPTKSRSPPSRQKSLNLKNPRPL